MSSIIVSKLKININLSRFLDGLGEECVQMYKRLGSLLLASSLLLTGCFPFLQQEEFEVVEEENELEETETVELSPDVYTPENYYRSVLYDGSYTHGEVRGFSNAVVYNRLDLSHLEMGLTTIANERFSPEQYYFREGQYINRNELNNWLMRYDETPGRNGRPQNPTGLNPPLGEGETMKEREENQPRVLSHILEHNYLVENGNGQLELAGVVVGLSMNSVYHYRIEDEQGRYYFYDVEIAPEKIEQEGKRIASEVVTRLRDASRADGALADVPIIVAIFQEEKREAIVPGTFIASAIAEPGRPIERWQQINEQYYFFPSNLATTEQRNDAERFMWLKDQINDFFDNYVGVVGKGYYKNGQLQELTVEVPIRFYGKMEVVALTQYIADRISQRFPNNLKIQVYVTSISGQESLIVRNPGEEPFMHIYE